METSPEVEEEVYDPDCGRYDATSSSQGVNCMARDRRMVKEMARETH